MNKVAEWNEQSWARVCARRQFWIAVGKKLFSWRILRVKNGHFYSPVPSMNEFRRDAATIFDRSLRDLPGIDIDSPGQLSLLSQLAAFYAEQPFGEMPRKGLRYFFDNLWYGRADGLFLYCMIRRFRPSRIIEVGSGFSSALMLDTNERFFDGSIRLTFIEPDPRRLRALLTDRDQGATRILEERIQRVDPAIVEELGPNDLQNVA